jgi:hypothetical protein
MAHAAPLSCAAIAEEEAPSHLSHKRQFHANLASRALHRFFSVGELVGLRPERASADPAFHRTGRVGEKKLQALGQTAIRVSKMHVHNQGMD